MVVDDEEFCQCSMVAILYTLKINTERLVDGCINGQEALDKVKEAYNHGITYSIIFMDFNMPILNGIEATKQIKQFYAEKDIIEIPKIFGVTGHV